jgi:hypothetical protein
MPSLSTFRVILLALVVTLPAACGGGGAGRPGPLKHTIDEMYIARIPMDQKQPVLEAENEYNIARMEQNQVEADYSESATELQVAKNELAQASLDEKSAQSRKKAADTSADMNRVDAANRELNAAKLSRQAAAKKVDYVKAKRELSKKKMLQAEDETYSKQSRHELAKARLAKANNIRPKGFDLPNYERQSQDRAKQAQRSKQLIQGDVQKTENLRREWQALVRDADRAKGQGQGQGQPNQTPAGTTQTEPVSN